MEEKDKGLNVKDHCLWVMGRLSLNLCSSSDVCVFPSSPCTVDVISLSPSQSSKLHEEVTSLNVPCSTMPWSHLHIEWTP